MKKALLTLVVIFNVGYVAAWEPAMGGFSMLGTADNIVAPDPEMVELSMFGTVIWDGKGSKILEGQKVSVDIKKEGKIIASQTLELDEQKNFTSFTFGLLKGILKNGDTVTAEVRCTYFDKDGNITNLGTNLMVKVEEDGKNFIVPGPQKISLEVIQPKE